MTQGPNKREAKSFEPPPWEKEAFEQLAREREQASAAEALRADEEAALTAEEPSAFVEVPPAQPGQAVLSAEGAADNEARHETGGEKPPSDPVIDTMILALGAEEPDALAGAWKVGLAVGGVLATMGVILIVWAAVGLARTLEAGPTGWLGAGIIGVMGAGFVAVGLWLGTRSLRKQGVL